MRFRQLAQFCCKAQAEAFAAQLAEAGIESLIRDPGSPFFSNTLAGDSCWVWVPVEDFDKAKAMTDDGRYSEDAVIEPLSLAEFQCPQCQSWGAFPADQTGLPVECMGCSRPFVLPMAAGRVGKPLPTGTTTKRLRLRRFVPADAPDLRDVRRDSSAVGHTGLDPLDMEGAEAEIVEVMKPAWIDGGIRCTFAIDYPDRSKVVGWAQFYHGNHDHRVVCATLMIGPDWRGIGLGKEALGGLARLAFDGFGAERLMVPCDPKDTAGVRLLARTGFAKEPTNETTDADGGDEDPSPEEPAYDWYAMERADWRVRRATLE